MLRSPAASLRPLILILGLAVGAALAGDNRFCGGPVVQTGEPTDLAHVVGDMTLEYTADMPASMMVCSRGYLLEKCGDHDTARRVFDKCIAAGYVGAMIWRALMLEDGAGEPVDLPAATELMRRAATSGGDSPYATLGKLHYASALHQGRGVARDEAAARQWFEAAARDGNPDAIEFLRTGYHVGERDRETRGVGIPPAEPALAGMPALPGELMEADIRQAAAPAPAARGMASAAVPVKARRLSEASGAPPAPSPSAPATVLPAADEVELASQAVPAPGQHLAPVEAIQGEATETASRHLAGLLLVALLAGAARQALVGAVRADRPAVSGA